MANINQVPQTSVEKGYNGFDMSKRVAFTSSVGQLLPVFSMICSPNDKIKYGADMFTRTQNLNTAAFARITEHIDYFFVPLTQLFQSFDTVVYQINDLKTSLMSERLAMQVPSTRYADVYDQEEGHDNGFFSKMFNNVEGNVFGDTIGVDEYNQPYALNAARLFSLLGIDPTPFECLTFNVAPERESISITFPDGESTFNHRITNGVPAFNVLKFAAYQKIWFDAYRLTDYDVNDPNYYNLDKFYSDTFLTSDDASGVDEHTDARMDYVGTLNKLFRLHYRPWKKDFFTNLIPSPLFNVNSNNAIFELGAQMDINQWLTEGAADIKAYSPDNTPVFVDGQDNATTIGANYTLSDLASVFNTANIRSMFAVDRLLDVLRRTPKHYDAMTQAFFGIKPNYGLSGEVLRLGSDMNRIMIDQVVSTADTEEGALGEIGGKGIGASQSQGNEFTAPCHGIFMAVYSAVPEVEYRDTAIQRENTYLKTFDFYNPVLDELGMQPLFVYQLPFNRDAWDHNFIENPTDIVGWQYRYAELKTNYDTVHGAFKYGLKHWVLMKDFVGDVVREGTTTHTNFYNTALYRDSLYIDPSFLDPIMEVHDLPWSWCKYYNGGNLYRISCDGHYPAEIAQAIEDLNLMKMSDFYERDPLIHSFEFHVFKSSKMSTYGIPNL